MREPFVIVAALALWSAPALAQVPQKLPLPRGPGEETLQFGNASLSIAMPPSDNAPITLTASTPGTKPVTLTLESMTAWAEQFPPNIFHGRDGLLPNATPEFFISRYTGGAQLLRPDLDSGCQ